MVNKSYMSGLQKPRAPEGRERVKAIKGEGHRMGGSPSAKASLQTQKHSSVPVGNLAAETRSD